MDNTDNILSLLDNIISPDVDEISRKIAEDFRHRRVEKNLTRQALAEKSGVPLSNIIRFENKGLVSLKNLILLAMATDYLSEVQNIFSSPKFTTMDELSQIRKKAGKTKAYNRRKK